MAALTLPACDRDDAPHDRAIPAADGLRAHKNKGKIGRTASNNTTHLMSYSHEFTRYRRRPKADHTEHFATISANRAGYVDLLEFVRHVAFATSEHVVASFLSGDVGSYTSARGIYRGLSRLFHEGYLARPAWWSGRNGFGSTPTVHLLTRDGLNALDMLRLRRPDAIAPLRPNERDVVARRVKRSALSLRHQVLLAQFHTLILMSAARTEEVAIDTFARDHEDARYRLRVALRPTGSATTRKLQRWPDAFLRLVVGQRLVRNYFIEIDTDDANPRKTARFRDRFLVYAHAINDGVYVREKLRGRPRDRLVPLRDALGIPPAELPTFNVLFIAATPERRAVLRDIARELFVTTDRGRERIAAGARGFLFAAQTDYLVPERMLIPTSVRADFDARQAHVVAAYADAADRLANAPILYPIGDNDPRVLFG